MSEPIFKDPKSVVVTGGAGFIGCALSQLLAPLACRYLVVDNLHPQVHPERQRPRGLHEAAELMVADVTLSETWDRILAEQRPDIIVHLAAETGTGQSLEEATRHANVNVVGTTQMLDALHRQDAAPQHLVLTSSRAVYGEGQWKRMDGTTFYPGQRTHEQLEEGLWDFRDALPLPSRASVTVPQPTSVYGATKLAQEHILAAWCASHSVPLSILRLQNVYGPGQSLANAYTGIVVLFAQLAKQGLEIPLYEDGEVTRDFVHIDDVIAAIDLALQKRPHVRQVFDVGSGTATTIRELAATLADMYGGPTPIVTGKFRDGDVRHARCSVEETEMALGWTPRRELRSGLHSLREWVTPY